MFICILSCVFPQAAIKRDFRDLRQKVQDMGLFKVDPWFYIFHLLHIILLEVLAVAVIWHYGTGWIPWLSAAFLMCTAQVTLCFVN